MISVLAQERLLGATLGSLFAAIVVFEQRKSIYKSISDTQPQLSSQFQVGEPIFGKKTRAELAHLWNKGVDQAFGPVIQYLSSRGW
ncbi:zinc finger, C3HC4 type family protein [Parasponia andersonii]|uniref:Zinc finger, C3HC4 type family protein n=1 Tax=Parasponia andersonii TaxID=3476 RepID=A0A2P5DU35_PARAD|nr:zinc finger, C3HC4 type family protein [Parasponia andersonii]